MKIFGVIFLIFHPVLRVFSVGCAEPGRAGIEGFVAKLVLANRCREHAYFKLENFPPGTTRNSRGTASRVAHGSIRSSSRDLKIAASRCKSQAIRQTSGSRSFNK